MTIDHKDLVTGLEGANGNVKASAMHKEKVDTYLNTLTEANEAEYIAYQNGIGQVPVYEINNQYFKVGMLMEEGLKKKQHKFATRNEAKYKNPLWQTSFLIALFRQIQDAPSLVVSKVFVTTGLPANDDKKSKIKDIIRDAFLNKIHCVNGVKFSIEDIFFIGQGAASFYNDLFVVNEEGSMIPNKKFLAETAPKNSNSVSKIMYVDAGFSTLDYRLVQGYALADEFFEDDGIEVIWHNILKRASKDYDWLVGVEVLEVEDQLRTNEENREIGKPKKIVINYEKADITKIYDEEMQAYAHTIIKQLYLGDFDNMTYDQVRFVGGASIPLKPYLDKAIEEYHEGNQGRMSIYKFVEDPQSTNCRGYVKFCQANVNKLRAAVTK